MALRAVSRFVAALGAAAFLLGLVGFAGSSTRDRPGVELTLRAVASPGRAESASQLNRSVLIMRDRLGRIGAHGSVTRKPGSQLILIRLDGVSPTTGRADGEVISKTGLIEFYDLTPSLLPPSVDASHNAVADTSLYSLLAGEQSGKNGEPSAFYLFSTNTKAKLAGPAAARSQLLANGGGKVPNGTRVLAVPGKAVVVTCDQAVTVACPGLATAPAVGTTYYYLFKHGVFPGDSENPYPQMTARISTSSGSQATVDPNGGGPIVTMQFTSQGDKLFHQITRDEAVRGQTLGNNDFQSFAIVLDDQLILVPDDRLHQVRGRDRPDRDRSRDHRPPVANRGQPPRARPPDRRAAIQVRHRLRTNRALTVPRIRREAFFRHGVRFGRQDFGASPGGRASPSRV